MAETNLNFDVPLLSTKPMNKTAISVRRNKTTTFTSNLNTSEPLAEMGLDEVTEAASVPFKWEHVPGRLKGNGFISEVKEFEAINRNLQKQVNEQGCEDEDDVFSDALDTLSPKLRLSNASEYDVLEAMKQPMPSKDFMMNRFLPAAKAMTVEQRPQYALKQKPLPAMSKPMRQIRDIVQAGKRSTPNRYESIVPLYYHEDITDEESDEDEDEDSTYLSKRGCGMSPQLCFKTSIDMLNSLSDLKEKPHSPMTPSHEQVKSSKVAQLKSRFQSMKKFALDSFYKQKLECKGESPEQKSIWKKFNLGTEQLESNYSTASAPASPYRQATCMSPYRSTGNSSPLHLSGFPGTRKEAEIMRANRLNKHIRNKNKPQELLYPKSTISVMEKTLYVDTENSPKIKDQSNTNVKILPETEISLPSEDADMARKNLNLKENALEENRNGFDLLHLAPPPPKKPSESWLLRNLPSLSLQIPSQGYLLHTQEKDLEENSRSVNKWETIVKTTYKHRDHIRYSEELVAPSKT